MRRAAAAVEAVARAWPMPVAIRVNGAGSEWHALDLDAAARSKADFVVVPRATSAHLVRDVAATTGKPVLAMIETAAGVLAAPEIAHDVRRADRRHQRPCAPTCACRSMRGASRSAIGAAVDRACRAGGRRRGVRRGVQRARRCRRLCRRSARKGAGLGFDGKSLIHPNQIAPCHARLRPERGRNRPRAGAGRRLTTAAPSASRTR